MKKVLIANRGEIAVRIIRACKELGLATVAIYSKADKEALHLLLADEAICVGEAFAADSYLNSSHVIAACEVTGADAIHPGYGFLSENAHFAQICTSLGITFIGPSFEAIALLGDKVSAKQIAKKVGCPVIPGSDGILTCVEEALEVAERIGYPLLLKSTAGGGGKGIRLVENRIELARYYEEATLEALQSFGNGGLYLEKKIICPRHIEMQILIDRYGNAIHLGERDCSIQRRRQKLIEESPSPVIDNALRRKLGKAALDLALEAGYTSAGTVEFLLDDQGNFYFMEVNTRIQVEHTVTEELTGVDLVKAQILIAQNKKLELAQEDVSFTGHVMEFRINSEDPERNFAPSPGLLTHFLPPGGRGIRLDTAMYTGYEIPPYYDSMIAKLIVKGKDRTEAFAIAKRALEEFHIGGVKTTISFHRQWLENPLFISGRGYSITTIDDCAFNRPHLITKEV